MPELKDEQAARYIGLAGTDERFRSQAEFKAKWRDAISAARESTEYFPPEYRLESATRADIAIRQRFAVRATAIGLDPERTWKEVIEASAYVWVASREGNSIVDLSSGFTQHDRQKLSDTVAQFKADERDRIAIGKQPSTYYAADDLGLNPATTDLQVRAAARYVTLNNIENPGLTTGFDRDVNAEKKEHRADLSVGFGF